ncbi:hypothetical protein BC829DRAFT_413371 [Chytridium lagenaria]|nr:hypothetical protein BC829DRAFT_413371 [Chytridium lagenaria]
MKWSPLHLAAAVEKLFDRGDEETANFVVSRRHSPARCDLVFAVEIRDLEEVRIIVHGNTDDIALESVEEALLKCVNMKSHEILTLLLFTVANKLTDEKREEILGTKVNIPAPAVTGISFSFTPASAATSSFSFGATNAVTTTDKMPFKSVPTIPSSFSKPRPIPRRVTSRALPSTSKVIKSFTASFAAGANDGSGNRHPLAPSFQLREVGLSFVESAASSSEFVPSFRVVEGETGLTVAGPLRLRFRARLLL